MHQPTIYADQVSSVTVVPVSYPDGLVIDWHRHDFHQLVYACSGVMTVETADNLWVIPPQRAVWVPAGVLHKVSMHGNADMRNLYVNTGIRHELPANSCVFTVSPLLRELILHLSSITDADYSDHETRRLTLVTLDQLKQAREVSFHLPVASDSRLKHICDHLQLYPEDNRTLSDWADHINTSSRSLSRLFRVDLGVSFVEYRQQVRLFQALKLLASGASVSRVALDVGFSSLSAFNRLFKRYFGISPGHFFN